MKDPTDLPALLVVLCRVQKSTTLRNYPRSFPATSLQRAAGGHAPADGQAWAPAPARGPIGDPICLLFLCALPRTIPSYPARIAPADRTVEHRGKMFVEN